MTQHQPLYDGPEWDFDLLRIVHDAIETIAIDELGLDVYRNQIEVITSEQMLDAYAATGMPLMYSHWSFGKRFAREELLYRKGAQALAYELVINSDPCVSYVMEENTATMQALGDRPCGLWAQSLFQKQSPVSAMDSRRSSAG